MAFDTRMENLDWVSGFGTASYGMGPVGGNSKCGGVGRAEESGKSDEEALRGAAFGRGRLCRASRAVCSEEVHRARTILQIC